MAKPRRTWRQTIDYPHDPRWSGFWWGFGAACGMFLLLRLVIGG